MTMLKSNITKAVAAIVLFSGLTGCATSASQKTEAISPIGAWASGKTLAACDTASITYFSSDGVVLVLLTKEGPIHSFGSWRHKGDILEMTHNDFPLDKSGTSKPFVRLNILELSPARFITKNAKGDVRERIKCSDITINPAPDHAPHE